MRPGAISGDRCQRARCFATWCPAVPPGEDAVPRRRTNRRAAVGVGEDHALQAQAIHIGRGDLPAVRIQAVDVAVAQIVAEHIENIGPRRGWRSEHGMARQHRHEYARYEHDVPKVDSHHLSPDRHFPFAAGQEPIRPHTISHFTRIDEHLLPGLQLLLQRRTSISWTAHLLRIA